MLMIMLMVLVMSTSVACRFSCSFKKRKKKKRGGTFCIGNTLIPTNSENQEGQITHAHNSEMAYLRHFFSASRERISDLKITFGTASRADLQLPLQVNSTSLFSY